MCSFRYRIEAAFGEQIHTFLMAHQHELTALVCYNDEVGLEVANVCSEIGLSIPDDLSIIDRIIRISPRKMPM